MKENQFPREGASMTNPRVRRSYFNLISNLNMLNV